MTRYPVLFSIHVDSLRLSPAIRPFSATRPEGSGAHGDEDPDGCPGDPMADPSWEPFGLDDDEDEPQPEYGDFWHEPDERED
ncbi:MAG TPA: hypothetical protein VGZ26_00540 [Pirellulales bacterium]|jgi:hypothetical protein|nr:hypothetical protein [Pirellulales bacterium]